MPGKNYVTLSMPGLLIIERWCKRFELEQFLIVVFLYFSQEVELGLVAAGSGRLAAVAIFYGSLWFIW